MTYYAMKNLAKRRAGADVTNIVCNFFINIFECD